MCGKSGSGNIGATNVSRKSPVLGALTLLLDALKGTAAVALSYVVADHMVAIPTFEQLALGALFAVLGHVFPVWLKFHGGKGVATGLGAFVVIAPKAVLIAAGIFIAVVAISRYVSLGSIVAVAVFPLVAWLIRQFYLSPTGLALMSIASLLILVKHRDNMRRLLGRDREPDWEQSAHERDRNHRRGSLGYGAVDRSWAQRDSSGSAVGSRKRCLRIHLTTTRERDSFFPGRPSRTCVMPCNDLAEALQGAAIVVSVMPSQHCRLLFEQMRPHLGRGNHDRQRDQGTGRKIAVAHD